MSTPVLAVPEKEERSAAAGVHIGAIFAPIWVPLIAYLVTRNSKPFVAAHARQSLVETLILNVLIGIAMAGSLCYTIYRAYTIYQSGLENVDWWPVITESLIRIGIWWLAMGILWLINLAVSIKQAIQAHKGIWPKSAQRRAERSAARD